MRTCAAAALPGAVIASAPSRHGSRQAFQLYFPSFGPSRKLAGAGFGVELVLTMKSGSSPVFGANCDCSWFAAVSARVRMPSHAVSPVAAANARKWPGIQSEERELFLYFESSTAQSPSSVNFVPAPTSLFLIPLMIRTASAR